MCASAFCVNVGDLTMLANVLAGNVQHSPVQFAAADVYYDGFLSVADLYTLANYLAGNIDHLPVIPSLSRVRRVDDLSRFHVQWERPQQRNRSLLIPPAAVRDSPCRIASSSRRQHISDLRIPYF